MSELKISSISNYKYNENNDSITEALSYFDNRSSIVKIQRKGFNAVTFELI